MKAADETLDGSLVRDQRLHLGLSVRQLAAAAGVSPAYVTAIETGRSPSTGRPPAVSLAVARRLSDALGLALDPTPTSRRETVHADQAAHVLAYIVTEPHEGIMAALDAVHGDAVDHWLHICDPRDALAADTSRVTNRQFPLGSFPYATPVLDPEALISALEDAVASLAGSWRHQRVGLVIADCSAVLRYLHDANAAINLERTWHERVTDVWQRHLGMAPAVDVCAYRDSDMAALGLTIDQLGTTLALVERHERVLVFAGGRTTSGPRAVRHLLSGARPVGTSVAAWERLVTAASLTLSTA